VGNREQERAGVRRGGRRLQKTKDGREAAECGFERARKQLWREILMSI
jgi:hypothetical protein